MFVCCERCVLSGRSLCDELITRPEESYRLRCVVVCDLETSWMRRPWSPWNCCAKKKKKDPPVSFLIVLCASVFHANRSDCSIIPSVCQNKVECDVCFNPLLPAASRQIDLDAAENESLSRFVVCHF